MNCSRKNFPLKSFFNEDSNEIMLFYRQGETFIITKDDMEQYEFEDIYDGDLGQLVMYKE